FKQDATKIKWFVIDKSDEFKDNYTNSKVTCGRLDIDGSQNEIFIKTNNIKANYVLATSFVHKSQSDTTSYYNIALKYWTKYRIGFKKSGWDYSYNDSRKEYDDLIDYEQNNLWLSDTNEHHRQDTNFSRIFNLDITVNKSLANRDRPKDIKARNEYALKLSINAPTLNTLIRHISQADAERIQRLQQKHNLPWASDLPISVFAYIVTEASKRMKRNQEQLFLDAMRFHELDGYLIDHEKLQTYTTSIKSLSLSPIYYYWALSKFKPDSSIASLCFKDILEKRISIDIKRQNSDEILNGTQTEIEIACNIYNTYCNAGNFFLPIYMSSISLVSDDDILGPLFKGYLPKLYKIPVSFQFPLPIIEVHNCVFPPLPPINVHSNENEENEEKYEQNIQEWSVVLKKMKFDIDTRTNEEIQITQEFMTLLRKFVADADIEIN
ncbi:24734_t:CDS:2, partial [Dentiscutata erythropus]